MNFDKARKIYDAIKEFMLAKFTGNVIFRIEYHCGGITEVTQEVKQKL